MAKQISVPAKQNAVPVPKSTPASSLQIWNNIWVHLGIVAIVTALLFSKFLFSGDMLYSSDQMGGLDSKELLRISLLKFQQLPLWFSSRLSGMPTIDAMFGDILYLPSLLVTVLFSTAKALGMKMVLHVFLAGTFFYLMLRRGFRTAPVVALAGALLYMLNPQFVSHVYPGHDGKMFVIAWLPFVIWRLKALMDVPTFLNSTFVAAGVSMMLFTSHIQMTYFALWGLFLYWVMASVLFWYKDRNRTTLALRAVYFWAAILLGIGAAFVVFYPSFMYVREAFSVRGVERGFEYAASWSMHWAEFFSLWVPEFGNANEYYWGDNYFKLNTEYAGAIALIGAALAIIKKQRPWRIFWGSLAALAVLYSMGAHTPVFHLAYYLVPGVRKFRAPSMMMFWFSFGTVLLCSLFLNDIARDGFSKLKEDVRVKWQKGLLVGLGVVFALVLLFSAKGFVSSLMGALSDSITDPQKSRIFERNFSDKFVKFLWLWLLFAGSALGILYLHIKGSVSRTTVIATFCIIGVIDVFRVNFFQFVKAVNPRPYFYAENTISDLKSKMANEPFRIFALPGSLPQNGAGVHGLEGVGGFHDNELRWYRDFRGDQQDRNFIESMVDFSQDGKPYLRPDMLAAGNNFLNLANARYMLVRNQGNQLIAVENTSALPRLSFVANHTVMDSSQILEALRSNSYDIKTTTALMEKPLVSGSAVPDSGAPLAAIRTKWNSYTPNRRSAEVTVPRDGFLRISEVYYPAWRVLLNGKEQKVYRADLAWMAIAIPEGTHQVEMVPASLYLGSSMAVSLPAIAILLLSWAVALVLSTKKKALKSS